MSYTVQQADIELLYQKDRQVYTKVELLNKDMVVVETLQGNLISDNYTIDTSSDTRRTYDATFCVKDSSFLIGENNKIWLDKYLRIYAGIKNLKTQEIIWYPLGVYLFNEVNYTYNSTTKEMSLSCVDLMSMLNDTFNGAITGVTTTNIPAYTNDGNSGITVMDTYTYVMAGTTMVVPKANINGYIEIYSDSNSISCEINGIEYKGQLITHKLNDTKTSVEVKFIGDTNLSYISLYYDNWWSGDVSHDTIWTFSKNDKQGAHPVDIKNSKGEIKYYKKIAYESEISYQVDDTKGYILVDGTSPYYTKIRNVIINTVTQLGGIENYWVEDINKTVPYDLEFNVGATVYEILSQLRDLYPSYEIFFDVDGKFIFQQIPMCYEDSVELTADVLDPLIISENTSNTLSSVRNVTEIFGQTLTANYYTELCTQSNNNYKATFEDMVLTDEGEIQNNILLGIKVPSTNNNSPTFTITANFGNDGETKTIENIEVLDINDNHIEAGQFKANTSYIFKYYMGKLYYFGQFQIHALALEVSTERTSDQKTQDKVKYNCENILYRITPNSPFTIEKIGERKQVLNGDNYEKIYADELAMERAKLENWKTTRLQDSISVEMINIPWLDVNKKVEYTSKMTKKTNQYIIKSIKGSTSGGTMTVELMRFYPEYIPDDEK